MCTLIDSEVHTTIKVTMGSPKVLRVGIICGSTRTPRIGPQITKFVHETIQTHLDTTGKDTTTTSSSFSSSSKVQLEIVDIADFHLPLFDEPGIPQAITDPSHYAHQHTRAWSARIAPLDAFVFVTPQYNWGVPAALKNALDFLYHEWKGKPALVVSYGGHGGGRAAEALRVVCMGLRMRVGDKTVNLSFPDDTFRDRCLRGQDLGLEAGGEGARGAWRKEKEEIVAVWEDMAAKLEAVGTA